MSSNIYLNSLTSSQGFSITGPTTSSDAGWSLKGAGDVNGDGYQDLIIGGAAQNNYAGVSYVLLGSASGWSNINLANYANYGFAIYGITSNNYVGWSVSGAGDINKDGYDDLIVGAPGVSTYAYAAGKTYVIFEQATSSLSDIDLSSFAGQGFSIYTTSQQASMGHSVSGAGDMNGDGYPDIIFNGNGGGNYGSGGGFILYGDDTSFSYNIDSSTITTNQGFYITGNGADGSCYGPGICNGGNIVSGLGDINGDGYDDIILGSTSNGYSFVILGNTTTTNIDVSSMTTSQGFSIVEAISGDKAGFSVAQAGDVNGDGYMDMLIGAPYADRFGQTDTGVAYVIFGGETLGNINLASLTISQGYSITGINANDNTGYSVAGLGDINGDGYSDIIVSAPGANSNTGVSYVIYGQESGFSNINLSSFTGAQGFTINGYSGYKTYTVAPAGDLNNDGLQDMMVSAPYANSYTGVSYVIYGSMPSPTSYPTGKPTGQPSGHPTGQPSGEPTGQPSDEPTGQPSVEPTGQPSGEPTWQPTSPTGQPTGQPSDHPTGQPSDEPTGQPSDHPTGQPTGQPTAKPTLQPTGQPSGDPSGQPIAQPTGQPSNNPTNVPVSASDSNMVVMVSGVVVGGIVLTSAVYCAYAKLKHWYPFNSIATNIADSKLKDVEVVVVEAAIELKDTTVISTTFAGDSGLHGVTE